MQPELLTWCSLCNARPSDGILEILLDGATETDYVEACTPCVTDIAEEDWIMNKDFGDTHGN